MNSVLYGLPLLCNLTFLFGPYSYRDLYLTNTYFQKTLQDLFFWIHVAIPLMTLILSAITLYGPLSRLRDVNYALAILVYFLAIGFMSVNLASTWSFQRLVREYKKTNTA